MYRDWKEDKKFFKETLFPAVFATLAIYVFLVLYFAAFGD